jgi:hypothetical protein
LAAAGAARAVPINMVRASLASDGTQANEASILPSISTDGRYVAFTSLATNLVPSDTNNARDVFVKDLSTQAVVQANVSDTGVQAASGSYQCAISGNGRHVTFSSAASNLVPGDTGRWDVFVKNLDTGAIVRASLTSSGSEANGHSAQAFDYCPTISADGRYVAFMSSATNLVAGDTNGLPDLFVKDLTTGAIVRPVPVPTGTSEFRNVQFPRISADGRHVVFQTTTSLLPSDTYLSFDIYEYNLDTATLSQVSVTSGGTPANSQSNYPSISADGRYVAFQTKATNLVTPDTNAATDVVVKDLTTGALVRATTTGAGVQGTGTPTDYCWPVISANGQFVAFASNANNLVPGDTNFQRDLFVKDLVTGAIDRANVAFDGSQPSFTVIGENVPIGLDLSGDGATITFQDPAILVPGDTNGATDIFVTSVDYTPLETVAAPSGLTAAPLSSTSLRLEWTDNSNNETAFRLERYTPSPFSLTNFSLPANTSSYTDTGLAPGTTYTYRLYATKGGIVSPMSNEASATTLLAGAPTSPGAVAFSSVRVDVTWVDNFTGEDGFEVWAATDGGAFSLLTTLARNVQYFRHTSFSGNHSFQYQVRAYTATNTTAFSSTATAIVMAQPLGLNSRALNSGQVLILWNDNATNEAVYEIWRGVGGGALTLLHTAPANTPQYTDSTVTANQTYTYQVRCRNGVHVSSATNVDTSPAMLAPTGLGGSAVSSTQVDLTWTDNSAGLETSFQIYRRVGAGTFRLIGTTAANAISFSDTTAQAGTSYIYQVRAASGNDWSSFSNTLPVTTP